MRKLLLPLIAAAMACFAVYHAVTAQPISPKVEPPVEPSRNPFGKSVAGAGIIEARSENISVGSHLPGIVREVLVKVGDPVKAGQTVLFRLDDRHLKAEEALRLRALELAEAQLQRLRNLPRKEEEEPKLALVREMAEALADQADQLKRARQLFPRGAITEEEMTRREQAYRMTREQYLRAKAEYDLLKAGAWKEDLRVAEAQVKQARAQLAQVRTELTRLEVRALVDGEVLQVNVRPGEFVATPPSQPLIVLGDLKVKHVRVDIDENDVPRFRPGAPAWATLRGAPDRRYALRFVRVDPYVIPKKSLTGEGTERVDTRVLQVIYALVDPGPGVYVGQQVDVFVEVPEAAHSEGR